MISESFDEDYYAVLGVRQSATAAQIKQAFRSKAKVLHPDHNRSVDATGEFIRLGEAYRVLRDDEQRQVFDAFRATVAPPSRHRRPVWRAAAAIVALLVSIGAASTFGRLALSGGPTTRVASWAPGKSAEGKSAPVAPARLPLAAEGGVRGSGDRRRDDAAEGSLAVAALVPASIRAPATRSAGAPASPVPRQAPPSPARGTTSAPAEDDETLIATLSGSVDALFATPQTAAVATAAPGDPHVSDAAALKTQQATATAVSPQRDRRLVRQVGVAPQPAAVLHKPIARAYAKPPYPVRVMRPYRVAAFPPYPRAYVRRPPVRRYQAPQWAARRRF